MSHLYNEDVKVVEGKAKGGYHNICVRMSDDGRKDVQIGRWLSDVELTWAELLEMVRDHFPNYTSDTLFIRSIYGGLMELSNYREDPRDGRPTTFP